MTENTESGAAGDSLNNNNKDSLKSFKYAIKTKDTRKGYLIRLGYFFDYLQILLGHSLEDRGAYFLEKVKGKVKDTDSPDLKWAYGSLTDYISYLKEKVEDEEIAGGTLKNYYAPIKLFYEQNDIELKWKKLKGDYLKPMLLQMIGP